NLQGGSPEYNMPMVFEVTGQLDTSLLSAVFTTIVERHEVLRTVYLDEQGHTLQQIRDMRYIHFEIELQDLSHLVGEPLEIQVRRLVEADITKPFDLASDLMLRVSYVQKTLDSGVMMFNMHHIASDGWSMEVLIKEFLVLCEAYHKKQANPLTPLAIQYADFAHWQRAYLAGNGLEGNVLESQLGYWEKQLDELPAVHSLPLDCVRPDIKGHQGLIVSGELPAATAKALLSVAKEHKLTPFMLLHGALSLLLSRHSNNHDIVIGTPVANRLQAELEPLIGFFINTLVLRADTSQACHNNSMADYFSHIRQVHLSAQSHQDVPFEQLVERLKVSRSTAHTPLFQIMLTTNTDYGLQEASEAGAFTLPGVKIKAYESNLIQSKFDLEVDLSISEQGVGLHWTYDTHLFNAQHIEQLNDHMCRLLEGLGQERLGQKAVAPQILPVLSQAEITHLTVELNDSAMDHPTDKCIHSLFEQQAAINPDAVALVCGTLQLTYKQLNEKANQLAHYLKDNHDVKPDTLIGLCVERSSEMIIGMLGILKAGGAYVPLDPGYPPERLSYMHEDAGLDVVLSQTQVQDVLADFKCTVIMLNGLGEGDDNHLYCDYPKTNPPIDTGLTASNLAYVIYTSGSTGQPKGVLIEHHCVANLVYSQQHTYQIDTASNEVGLVLASFAFDAAVEQIFVMLLSSNTLVLPSVEQLLAPEKLLKLVASQQVTHIDSTPSHLISIIECLNHQTVKRVISGGEAILPQLIDAINPHTPLFNVYGPTEACVTSSVATSGSSIGKPVANTAFYLLDDALQLAPKGTAAQLFIGGDGLARGYLNRPELTAEYFIDNPFGEGRIYRTGD
ncbi:MAG: amino acid adenylation domain-containing protein, partial [Psychrosphaera sp.]|nr:amino acid adenylation domain-containing protein [Psychrosphaera sp.]